MELLVLAFALAGGLPQTQTEVTEPKRGDTIMVRGCISGATIESSDTEVVDGTGRLSSRVTFRLTGEKKTLKQIRKEHDGHADVITGLLKSDLPHQNAPRGKRIGNTRVVIGAGDQTRATSEVPPFMPALQVKAFEHTGATCTR